MNFTHDMIKPIQLKVEKRSVIQDEKERLTSSYSAGKVTLRGADESNLLYGKKQLEIAMKSGHLKEYLGETHPKLPLRPLWIKGDQPLGIEGCERILEYGFNAVITEEQNIQPSQLKIILPVKVENENHCFFDEEYQELLQRKFSAMQAVDYILWEGTFNLPLVISHPKAEELLEEEIALFEVQLLETLLPEGVGLIYYLPASTAQESERQSEWFLDFCNDVGNQTTIAFPAVAGVPTQSHLPLHPFWDRLRQSIDFCSTPLLPIVNVGSLDQGEGFWPLFPFEEISNIISRCIDHSLSGAISMISRVPQRGALLDGTLWVTGQMLWTGTAPNQLAETWFSAMRPELNYQKHLFELKRVDLLCREISRLREMKQGQITHEECRESVEAVLVQLRRVQSLFSQNKSSKKELSFFDYFTYFAKDASKIILHFLQQQNIPMSSLFRSVELEESFWTDAPEGTKSTVQLLKEPKSGEPGSVMNKIYHEVYGYDSRTQGE